MYQDYFGFREAPFTLTPNPEFLFLSRCHQEAYAHLLYAIESRAGFIELSGEVGTGKTTIIRTLLGQLPAEKFRSALIFNPTLSPLGLMQEIVRELGLAVAGNEPSDLHQILNEFLLRENAADRTVVLVIDEAQNLSRNVLEQVRLISNLETAKEKLIQIVLVGQPELKKMLSRDDLRQLNQRITVRYHLDRMDSGDIHAYIRHRIRIAAEGREPVIFSPAAVKRIAGYAKGLPRLINSVCDRALLLAYTMGVLEITGAMAATAIADLRKGRRHVPLIAATVVLVVAIFTAAALFVLPGKRLRNSTTNLTAAADVYKSAAPGGVMQLQEMLKTAGFYPGQPSGQFDAQTESAVKSFQKAEGLKDDGKPGGQTLMRLYQRTGGKFSTNSAETVKVEVKQ